MSDPSRKSAAGEERPFGAETPRSALPVFLWILVYAACLAVLMGIAVQTSGHR